jgi:hypothetical protein
MHQLAREGAGTQQWLGCSPALHHRVGGGGAGWAADSSEWPPVGSVGPPRGCICSAPLPRGSAGGDRSGIRPPLLCLWRFSGRRRPFWVLGLPWISGQFAGLVLLRQRNRFNLPQAARYALPALPRPCPADFAQRAACHVSPKTRFVSCFR